MVTFGLISCWQVFDQIYAGTKGGPAKTTVTPAYLSFNAAFNNGRWGQGAAIAFMLFVIIIIFAGIQRWVLRDKDEYEQRRLDRQHRRAMRKAGMSS